jgi:hypothetical protein
LYGGDIIGEANVMEFGQVAAIVILFNYAV